MSSVSVFYSNEQGTFEISSPEYLKDSPILTDLAERIASKLNKEQLPNPRIASVAMMVVLGVLALVSIACCYYDQHFFAVVFLLALLLTLSESPLIFSKICETRVRRLRLEDDFFLIPEIDLRTVGPQYRFFELNYRFELKPRQYEMREKVTKFESETKPKKVKSMSEMIRRNNGRLLLPLISKESFEVRSKKEPR